MKERSQKKIDYSENALIIINDLYKPGLNKIPV
jgi:hypothetical protein